MARPTRTLLMRHGEVAAEWRTRIYGGFDVPLSPRGERQSRAAAAALAGAATGPVIASGLGRTLALGLLLVDDPGELSCEARLAENDRGDWLGRTWDELDAQPAGGGGGPGAWKVWWGSGGRTRAPGGESLTDLKQRVLPAVRALVSEHAGQTLTLVAHSWVHRVLLATALGLPVEGTMRFGLPTAGLAVLDWHTDGRVELAGLRPGEIPKLS